MPLKRFLFAGKVRNPGDLVEIEKEPPIPNIKFKIHKITNRKAPDDPRRHFIFPCFSEFGSEVVASMYCLPRIMQTFPGHYKTVIGWHGREYLYRHLADEFWELDESFMWLREYCRAFHHDSSNLKKFEESLKGKGIVISPSTIGKIAIGTQCNECHRYWTTTTKSRSCSFCGSLDLRHSLYSDIDNYKKQAVRPPSPSPDRLAFADTLLGRRPVGVFARSRKCYGRNLPPEFYVSLIELLRGKGYEPIWLGEKATTLPCPVPDVLDFSRMDESRDLETTLAIVSKCEFTVQFWTASTRLAALTETPYLLFESPDQIWGKGQEGYRLDLVTTGKRKIVASHYLNVLNDQASGIVLVDRCVREMENGDYSDVIGMVDEMDLVAGQRVAYLNAKNKKG